MLFNHVLQGRKTAFAFCVGPHQGFCFPFCVDYASIAADAKTLFYVVGGPVGGPVSGPHESIFFFILRFAAAIASTDPGPSTEGALRHRSFSRYIQIYIFS